MVGDIVTIIANNPRGVKARVNGETGVIVEFDERCEMSCVATGNPESNSWWFTDDEFRPATDEEIKARLRFVLMK